MDKRLALFIKTLKENELSLALAESVTCGLAAHLLAGVPGTSEVLKGSVVCYTPAVKTGLLGIPQKLVTKYSCESMEVTEALAKHLPKIVQADIHAAVTGLASVGGSETSQKPVGTVFFAVHYRGKLFRQRHLFNGSPLNIRKQACFKLYRIILDLIST